MNPSTDNFRGKKFKLVIRVLFHADVLQKSCGIYFERNTGTKVIYKIIISFRKYFHKFNFPNMEELKSRVHYENVHNIPHMRAITNVKDFCHQSTT